MFDVSKKMPAIFNYLFSRWNVFGQFDFGKVSFANGFQKSIFPNMGLFTSPSRWHPRWGAITNLKQRLKNTSVNGLENLILSVSTLALRDILALGLGMWSVWLGLADWTTFDTGKAWAVGGKDVEVAELLPLWWPDDLLGVGGKHLGVGMTLPVLNLAAVSSAPVGQALMTFMIARLALDLEVSDVEAGAGCRRPDSRLSLTGLVKFSGGLEYWISSGAGTGDPGTSLCS